ncbi:Thioredoxin C-2 [Rosistilla carotiformis]|uniref:Thioredoxin C-2 n=1 Tax=Rosistilla carotiformis TaxID=2528017 RepID=A0A518JV89_9BACT|nr:tetratricopeptide repeat protein [Rosistilla carotiformis]QDV69464.1 Thioredoxin C-2 [Rosistilla carotiformis]
MNKSNLIETTDRTFEIDVLERSQTVPVVIDFWADWCQPCRALAPLLEQMAEEFAGDVAVVKANTDHCQQAATEFSVSGIPAIFGVVEGAIVDGLQGVVSEEVLRVFFRRMVSAGEFVAAKRTEDSNPAAALATYQKMLAEDPENVPAKIGLGRASLAAGDVSTATQVLDDLESRGFLEPEAEQLKSRLSLAAALPTGDLGEMEAQLAADPNNPELKIEVARMQAAAGNFQTALDLALAVVESTQGDRRDPARLLMIDIFRTLPDDSPLTGEYRRKLASALY